MPRSGILDCMVALLLVFKETSILFSIVAAPIYIITSSVGGSLFLTLSPAFKYCFIWASMQKDGMRKTA